MKLLKFAVVLVVILVLFSVLFYQYTLPGIIADTIVSDKPGIMTSIIPGSVQRSLKGARETVEEKVIEIPQFLVKNKMSFDDLLIIVDRSGKDDILNAFEAIKNAEISSTDQVFSTAMRHIKVEGYDLEVFRDPFNKDLTVSQIRDVLKMVEDSDINLNFSIPIVKATAKKILLDKKDMIEQKLDEIKAITK